MSLIRWEPIRNFENLFDRYTRTLGAPLSNDLDLITTGDWAPRIDICEGDTELIINAEIPDVKKEDVKVSVDEGVLTIQGEKKQEKEDLNKRYYRTERYYGKFMRSFTLPNNVDESHINASFKNGMLSLHIPKTGEVKHQAIEVKLD